MSGYVPPSVIALIDTSICEATAEGVMMLRADDAEYTGSHVEIGGERLRNFGGCSYLGLEQRSELKRGAIAAIERYGTQFSFSRAYLESPLYRQLEDALCEMTGGFAMVTPSTTLGHLAALPVLIGPGDAVLIDQFTHASVHMATGLLRGPRIEPVRHNDIGALERKIIELSGQHERVWYLADGIYSMLGDAAPMAALDRLLEAYPKLHIYLDDAHATSWTGARGRGLALDALRDKSRVVVALSLNKAFSAAGGALIFPNEELRRLVRHCGGPMLFSGPVQPPMLGAALASARLQLSDELPEIQAALRERIELARTLARELGLSFASDDATPIFFVRCGALKTMYPVARAVRRAGFYVSPSGFPAVPKNQSGLRFTLSTHNSLDDVRDLITTIAREAARIPAPSGSVSRGARPTIRAARPSSAPPPSR
jgi:7-keto-8-aminopelargonate synthetase-like enzyme